MTDCALKLKITEDMKDAMRAKDVLRLSTIRMLLAAIKQKEVDERVTLTDADIFAILNKMIKQRRESVAQFRDAKRLELAEKEEHEIEQLTHYLPQQLSDAELDTLVADAIKTSGATSVKDMGKVMGLVKTKAQGRANMALVSEKIKNHLSA